MAVPVAREHGARLCRCRDQGRTGDFVDRVAEAALRARRYRRHAAHAGRKRARHLGARAGLLRSQRCRRCGDGRRRLGEGREQARTCSIHPRTGDRLGSKRTGVDPPGTGSDRWLRSGFCLRVHEQGLLPTRRVLARRKAAGYARRAIDGRCNQIRRCVSGAGGILRVRE